MAHRCNKTYWNLLEKIPPRQLKLTKFAYLAVVCCIVHRPSCRRLDDQIYEHTTADFPELFENAHSTLINLDEDWMKSADGKERWRKFINE
jgi:hypothetical protein